jgi:hypothetical protein
LVDPRESPLKLLPLRFLLQHFLARVLPERAVCIFGALIWVRSEAAQDFCGAGVVLDLLREWCYYPSKQTADHDRGAVDTSS